MENAPQGPKPSELEVSNPELFAYLKQKIESQVPQYVVEGEKITPRSLQAIAHMTALNAERMGTPLTKEAIDAMGEDLQSSIIDATSVRLEHDNPNPNILMTDVQGRVIGSAENLKGIQQIAVEENRRDVA